MIRRPSGVVLLQAAKRFGRIEGHRKMAKLIQELHKVDVTGSSCLSQT